MKIQLESEFHEFILEDDFSFGYIQPGHGSKGRQQPVVEDRDLAMMYDVYKKKRQVLLWLKVTKCKQKKRPSNNDVECQQVAKQLRTQAENVGSGKIPIGGGKSNHDGHLKKMSEVELIVDQLEEIHSNSQYTPEQIRAWAHLIQMKKHDSYNDPPKKPFFKGQPKSESSKTDELSPDQRIRCRSECIDQLDKWHSLLKRGAISQDEFDSMQKTILSDIKKF